jgi:hypothetical protein
MLAHNLTFYERQHQGKVFFKQVSLPKAQSMETHLPYGKGKQAKGKNQGHVLSLICL